LDIKPRPLNSPQGQPSHTFFSEALLPTALGRFRVRVYRDAHGDEAIALIAANVEGRDDVAVRVHSACLTSEAFGSLKCDCREQLDLSLEYIQRHGGIVIYLQQEGRGIGFGNKIKAYALQAQGHDTVSANEALDLPVDARSYEAAASILADLGIRRVRLMTNNPAKIAGLRKLGIEVTGTIPVLAHDNVHSIDYLETKRVRMGHMIAPRRPAHVPTAAPAAAPSALLRPHIHLNFAIRAPGTIQSQASSTVSCAADWRRVHELRERYTAIAVGATTWCKDRPRLTAREEHLKRAPRRQPEPVIFMGSKGYWPEPDGRRTFVVGGNLPPFDGFIGVRAEGHDLAAPLETLRALGIESMLVEGGPTLLRSFLEQGIADEITIYASTPFAELARECAAKQFPRLLPPLTAERLGEGTLLRWERTA
jgi:GTP cyclohydrolase II